MYCIAKGQKKVLLSIIGFGIAIVAGVIAFYGAIGFVLVHFIRKWW